MNITLYDTEDSDELEVQDGGDNPVAIYLIVTDTNDDEKKTSRVGVNVNEVELLAAIYAIREARKV